MKLDVNNWISIIGVFVTIISMVVSIYQANKAKSYKEIVFNNMREIHFSQAKESLKIGLSEIEKLPTKPKRGRKIENNILTITTSLNQASINGIIDMSTQIDQIRGILREYQSAYINNESQMIVSKYDVLNAEISRLILEIDKKIIDIKGA